MDAIELQMLRSYLTFDNFFIPDAPFALRNEDKFYAPSILTRVIEDILCKPNFYILVVEWGPLMLSNKVSLNNTSPYTVPNSMQNNFFHWTKLIIKYGSGKFSLIFNLIGEEALPFN